MNDKISNFKSVISNPWHTLKGFTDARIALGRAGSSIPTHEMLKFQLEHAQARDAVHLPLNAGALYESLKIGLNDCPQALDLFASDFPLLVSSCADDRGTYLQRPDLGRRLSIKSTDLLEKVQGQFDLAICVVDGLSAMAIEQNISPFLKYLFECLPRKKIRLAPLVICNQGRVAIGDHIAQSVGAKTVMVLIGERPGLLSPDSMGMYLTFDARVGCHDAQRNCVSNIRPAGLSYDAAAVKTIYLLDESQRLGFSGVELKERSEQVEDILTSHKSFLTQ